LTPAQARARARAILGIEDLGSLVSGLLESCAGLTAAEKKEIIEQAHEIADALHASAGQEARDWYMRSIGAT
jgi:hypothetical protein